MEIFGLVIFVEAYLILNAFALASGNACGEQAITVSVTRRDLCQRVMRLIIKVSLVHQVSLGSITTQLLIVLVYCHPQSLTFHMNLAYVLRYFLINQSFWKVVSRVKFIKWNIVPVGTILYSHVEPMTAEIFAFELSLQWVTIIINFL